MVNKPFASSLKNKKILITCGPTWVSIDPMRVISNRSTGELGHKLALALANQGAKVTLLEGPVTKPLIAVNIKIVKFCFYDELRAILLNELKKKYDIVIHNAAVSDYQLRNPFQVKVGSNKKKLTIDLFPTEKLINKIKKIAPQTLLVGFKLENFRKKSEVIDETKALVANSQCDLIVANTLKGGYQAYLLDKNAKIWNHSRSRAELTKNLILALKLSLTSCLKKA